MPQYLVAFEVRSDNGLSTYRGSLVEEMDGITEESLTLKAQSLGSDFLGNCHITNVIKLDGQDQTREWSKGIDLMTCGMRLPPVDSPLLIEVAPGVLAKASRPAHAESKDDTLTFTLEGGTFLGRPRWTHA